jgi:hypothetical protein
MCGHETLKDILVLTCCGCKNERFIDQRGKLKKENDVRPFTFDKPEMDREFEKLSSAAMDSVNKRHADRVEAIERKFRNSIWIAIFIYVFVLSLGTYFSTLATYEMSSVRLTEAECESFNKLEEK